MAGVFAGHLIDSFLSAQQPRGPFGMLAPNVAASSTPQIQTVGSMAFAPQMHGSFGAPQMSAAVEPQLMDLSVESAKRIAALQAKLDKRLGPEYISQRPGPGGGPKLTYVEGWKIISLANEVFGFNGWSSSVTSLVTDFIDYNEQSGRYSVGATAIVRVTLRDGVYHEDVGYGMLENAKSKGAAMDKCKKEAVTDAIKRTLRNFGNVLGNCLYDKAYAQEIVKIKVPPPKFDRNDLYRRPEFDQDRTGVSTGAPAVVSTSSAPPKGVVNETAPQQMRPPANPASSLSAGARAAIEAATAEMANAEQAAASTEQSTPMRPNNTASTSGVGPSGIGLVTPMQTPRHPPQQPQPQQPVAAISNKATSHQANQASCNSAQPHARRIGFAQPSVPAPSSNTGQNTSRDVQPDAARPDLSVAIPNTEDIEDDTYGLNSEDDAFFASVDLAGFDSGIGGHIDFDEGAGGMHVEEPVEENPLPPPPPHQERRLLGTSIQRQQQQLSDRPPVLRQQQQAQARSTVQPVIQNQEPSSSAGSVSSQSRPSSTPSMGGFHFPPGVNHRAGSSTTSGSGVGLKRSADAMQYNSARRPLQGMGLMRQPGGSATVGAPRREPLAPLEGGDLKRARC